MADENIVTTENEIVKDDSTSILLFENTTP